MQKENHERKQSKKMQMKKVHVTGLTRRCTLRRSGFILSVSAPCHPIPDFISMQALLGTISSSKWLKGYVPKVAFKVGHKIAAAFFCFRFEAKYVRQLNSITK